MKAGWQTKKLGDAATLQRGFDLPTQDRVSGTVPLVSSSGIIDTHHKSAVRGPGVVTGRSGSIGNIFFIEEDFWPLNTTLYVKDFHGNDPRFVFHLLKHFDLNRFATGSGVLRSIGTSCMTSWSTFRLCSNSGASWASSTKRLTTSPPPKPRPKRTSKTPCLFESHLQAVFTKRGEGWVESLVGSVCDIKHGFAFCGADFSSDIPEGNPIIVTPGNFTEDGRLLFNERNTKRFSGEAPAGFRFDVGDLVVVMTDLSSKMYDGKDYFTIYDFVRAYHHFNDPEWDGEPVAPEPGPEPNPAPGPPPEPPGPRPGPGPRPARIKVKLADGKARTIQHMMMTSFWHPDGTPMSAQQFLEMLFGKLPEFFKDEAELRALWSDPDTRARLLEGLAEKGFGRDQMAEMQKIIDAENSDLFDVLAHVAYALPPLTREERATRARVAIGTRFNTKQQVFLGFVLSQYVKVGVEELDRGKLSPLLKLKYNNAIADAWADLGRPEEVGYIFAGFQKYLYQPGA
jgi:EcoEI R protein C-terminal/Type I restriction modification DNA specificity domain